MNDELLNRIEELHRMTGAPRIQCMKACMNTSTTEDAIDELKCLLCRSLCGAISYQRDDCEWCFYGNRQNTFDPQSPLCIECEEKKCVQKEKETL